MKEKGSEKKISKGNNLVSTIRKMDLDSKTARFYTLKNIKTIENNFLDI